MNNKYYAWRNIPERDEYASDNAILMINASGYAQYETTFSMERTRTDYYIMYLTEGEFCVEFNGEMISAGAGDLVFFRPDEKQKYYKTNTERFKYYWIHFTGYAADDMLKICQFEKSGVYRIGLSDNIIQHFKKHFSEFYAKPIEGTYMEISAAANVMELFSLMRKTLENNSVKPGSAEQKIYSSARYINENYTSPLCVEELARREGLCSGYYSKMFTRYFGVSPQNYIIRIRIQNACMMLQQSDMSITEIAQSVGYEDSLYFSRIFRKNLGMSPMNYRMLYRRNSNE
ncbi:MAG: helix-turn-helix domain-containing protein [Ruminococcaceae bacterium]|nr:helix-turn-helix domain-containing protein [Oscillospiraceae bacterium]